MEEKVKGDVLSALHRKDRSDGKACARHRGGGAGDGGSVFYPRVSEAGAASQCIA
jgi:hypothetical protein